MRSHVANWDNYFSYEHQIVPEWDDPYHPQTQATRHIDINIYVDNSRLSIGFEGILPTVATYQHRVENP